MSTAISTPTYTISNPNYHKGNSAVKALKAIASSGKGGTITLKVTTVNNNILVNIMDEPKQELRLGLVFDTKSLRQGYTKHNKELAENNEVDIKGKTIWLSTKQASKMLQWSVNQVNTYAQKVLAKQEDPLSVTYKK